MNYALLSMISPCLRWAGGKRWLIKYVDQLLPPNGFQNYHEPFLGGASMFLSIGLGHMSFLSDLNKELIETYIAIRDIPYDIISILSTYKNEKDFYYKIRSKRCKTEAEKAARFIYLNQTSYNGIYRVNLKGEYNVPYGFREKKVLDEKSILDVSDSLQNMYLEVSDFDIVRKNIDRGDLVFLDPPYTVSHNTNGFIKYNQKIFSLEDQYRLRTLIDYIEEIGAYYILTNAAHQTIKEIFSYGNRLIELNRANLIGGTNAQRGQTSEYIFTNI